MRAAVYETYGPPEVVHLAEVPRPVPKDDEVLIRVHATTVTTADWRARSLSLPRGFGPLGRLVFGINRPRRPILGTELSGVVEAVGRAVTRFRPGDAVFAYPGLAMGAHAEYRTIREDGPLAPKPQNLSHEEAAALCFGGTTGLFFYRRGNLKAGEAVLVVGASGNVGSSMVQLAKHFGAVVTGVASTANLDLARSLGADRVIDYTRQDFAATGEKWDVVVDTTGSAPINRARKVLKESGRLLMVLGDFANTIGAPFRSMIGKQKIVAGTGPENPADVRLLGELAAAGKLRAVIDRVYPFDQIVEAHRHTDTGHKRGSVVVRIA